MKGNTKTATCATPTQLQVVEIPVGDLTPNPWNVNKMSEEMLGKLTAYLRKEGLVEPIVVRRKKGEGEAFEILGGYHRWLICKERLAHKTVPCVVLDLDDKRAKVLSINLNEMKGEPVPALLADLIHDLNKEISLPDLETLLPYSTAQLDDYLELLKLPEGLDAMLEEQAKAEEAEAPVVITFVLDKKQNELFEGAVEKALKDAGATRNKKGRAVELISRAFLGQKE